MKKNPANDAKSPQGHSGRTPDYLFHVQKRTPPEPIASDKTAPLTPKQPHEIFMAGVKTSLMVIGGMIGVLVVLSFFLRSCWRVQEAKQEKINTSWVDSGVTNQPPAVAAGSIRTNWPNIFVPQRPDPEKLSRAALLAEQGKHLAHSNQYEAALQTFDQALSIWPALDGVQAEYGRVCLHLGLFPRAQAALEKAMDESPNSASLLNDLGVALFRQNRVDRAMKLFQTATQIDTEYAAAYFNLALCYIAQADRMWALNTLDRYLMLVPDDPEALKEKAFLDAVNRHYTSAMDTLKKALKIAPQWAPLYFDAAATAALMGDADTSISYLKQAESYTSSVAVYLVFQQPAFRDVRRTEGGSSYLNTLTEKVGTVSNRVEPQSVLESTTEPKCSTP